MKAKLIAPVADPASVASALVCESLQPLQEITSAGLVLVALVNLSAFWVLPVAVLTMPMADLKTPPISPRAYEDTAERRPWPASAARLGSLIFPSVE